MKHKKKCATTATSCGKDTILNNFILSVLQFSQNLYKSCSEY